MVGDRHFVGLKLNNYHIGWKLYQVEATLKGILDDWIAAKGLAVFTLIYENDFFKTEEFFSDILSKMANLTIPCDNDDQNFISWPDCFVVFVWWSNLEASWNGSYL